MLLLMKGIAELNATHLLHLNLTFIDTTYVTCDEPKPLKPIAVVTMYSLYFIFLYIFFIF